MDKPYDSAAHFRTAWWQRLQREPATYELTRFAILRLLAFVYLVAFIGLANQFPPLIGSRVTVANIFRYATQHMPMQSAFALTDDQYVRIMAAILKQNGFPAGTVPLTYALAARSTAKFPVVALRIVAPKK